MFNQEDQEFKNQDITPEPVENPEDEFEFGEATQDVQAEDDRAWFVVHCYSGYENKVRHNLENRRNDGD